MSPTSVTLNEMFVASLETSTELMSTSGLFVPACSPVASGNTPAPAVPVRAAEPTPKKISAPSAPGLAHIIPPRSLDELRRRHRHRYRTRLRRPASGQLRIDNSNLRQPPPSRVTRTDPDRSAGQRAAGDQLGGEREFRKTLRPRGATS